MERIITLTTDFGLKDPYQGAMKGAILSINPGVRIVDITHLVQPGNILEGAFVLLGASRYFPEKTIHVAVVDPGVGGDRKPILVETRRFFYIGPDNGLLSPSVREDGILRAVELTNRELFRDEVMSTFHGRDIFGPVAAHLSLGAKPEETGQALDKILALDLPKTVPEKGGLRGEVVYIDSFGNLITNIRREDLSALDGTAVEVTVKNAALTGLKKTYAMVEKGAATALIGSTGYLEVAVNRGNAAEALGARVGDTVAVRAVK
ncbi:MAG: S-adenosyl-l-methionine hydroxide adenosyltransferase family protein [Candidatus Methylomirabilis sp.]|nr:S-adenosyl-l-methionine hydroxide adenosyltransferase family protein [Deltaproteobacteria bacterium]